MSWRINVIDVARLNDIIECDCANIEDIACLNGKGDKGNDIQLKEDLGDGWKGDGTSYVGPG